MNSKIFVIKEEDKWNDETKPSGLIIEENGIKVRMTQNHDFRNVVSTKGYSQGVHAWILEFGQGCHCGFAGWNIRVVCEKIYFNSFSKSGCE